MHAVEDTYQNGIKIKFGHESSGTQAMHFGSIMKGTVLADKIRSNIFRAVFLDSRVGPSYFRYSLSCSPGSVDSKLVLHFSVALLLSILQQF